MRRQSDMEMTLRRKAFLIISLILVCLIVLLYVTSSFIMVKGFEQVEHNDAQKNVGRVLEALSDELSDLNGYASDWAAWDPSYEFVNNPDNTYVEDNVPDDFQNYLALNLFLFTNSSDDVVLALGFDLQNMTKAPVSEGLKSHLSSTSPLLQHDDKDSSLTGIIMLPEGPMMVISRPVLDSAREKPISGTMIWGRYLNDEKISRLEEKTHLSISVQPYNEPLLPYDFNIVKDSFSEENKIIIRPLNEQSISGYTILRDIYGNPAVLLRVDIPRDIYNQGQRNLKFLLFSVVFLGLIFGSIFILLLERLVLSRITDIVAHLNRIGDNVGLSGRVKVKGDDELSNLAGSINRMLEAQEHAQKEREEGDKIRHENDRLMYASKLKADFLANMNHGLRTPMNSILGFSELLKRAPAGELDEKQIRKVDNILASGKNLLSIIDTSLDINKVDAGEIELVNEKVSVQEILDELFDQTKETAEKNKIVLIKELDPALKFIDIDLTRFKQILWSLLSNAVKFSKKEGGTVTVTARREGDNAKFSIRDTGIGIRRDDLEKIFKEFEQLDSGNTRKYGGTGLGLAMTKRLVELLGGKIHVESSYGEGTTFTFTLPVVMNKEG
jgi:signal transduction histidine kinase